MAKPYRWTSLDHAGMKIGGEAHDEADAAVRAAQAGSVPEHFHVEENPEFTDSDALDAAAPEVSGQSIADAALKNKTDIQVLAEANATLFNQVDGLKNQIAGLEMERDAGNSAFSMLRACHEKALDAKALILAWNTEQQARATAENREYQEPAWLDSMRHLV